MKVTKQQEVSKFVPYSICIMVESPADALGLRKIANNLERHYPTACMENSFGALIEAAMKS